MSASLPFWTTSTTEVLLRLEHRFPQLALTWSSLLEIIAVNGKLMHLNLLKALS